MEMKNYAEKTIRSADGYALSARLFDTPHPKAAVLFIHGMEEHQGRYVPFATFLQENGYAVLTADLRGHGENAPKLCHIADRHGDRLLMEDEEALLKELQAQYPGVPVYLFAHSMGTIIARKWLQTRSGSFGKVALSGYPNPNPAAGIGIGLGAAIASMRTPQGYSKLLDTMVLGGFSKAVKDAESPLDWLSVNRENVQAYAQDPLCGVPFTLGSYDALFRLLADINKPEMYRDVQAELPILLIAGSGDPCVGGAKGRADSKDRLARAGFRNIVTEDLEGMRHEILNEKDNGTVYRKILDFFEA